MSNVLVCAVFVRHFTDLKQIKKKVKIHYVGFYAKQFSLLEVLILSEGINTSFVQPLFVLYFTS